MKDYQSACCMHGELPEGWGYTGGQRKRYKDSLKSSPKAFEINNESWESLAAERGTWRSLISKGTYRVYGQTRIRQADEKRLLRKASAAEASSALNTDIQCPKCDRTLRARIGFTSHIAYTRQASDVIMIIIPRQANKSS